VSLWPVCITWVFDKAPAYARIDAIPQTRDALYFVSRYLLETKIYVGLLDESVVSVKVG
jgi:hypothetical protein